MLRTGMGYDTAPQKGVGFAALVTHDSNNDFRSEFGRWVVEGDGGDRIAAKALLGFPRQPR